MTPGKGQNPRQNGDAFKRAVANERGSALVIALALAVVIAVVVGVVMQEYVAELNATAATRRSIDKAGFATNLASLFSERTQCAALLRTTLLAPGAPAPSPLSTLSPALAALSTAGGGPIPIISYQALPMIGPVASSGSVFLAPSLLAAGNYAGAQRAAFLSLQPWSQNPNFASKPVPAMASSGSLESVLAPSGGATAATVPMGYRSMTKSGLYIKSMVIFEEDPAALPTPAGATMWTKADGTSTGVVARSSVIGTGRAFHVWADFGMASDAVGLMPSSASLLDIAATGSGASITGCTIFANARSNDLASLNSAFLCPTGHFLQIVGGALSCN